MALPSSIHWLTLRTELASHFDICRSVVSFLKVGALCVHPEPDPFNCRKETSYRNRPIKSVDISVLTERLKKMLRIWEVPEQRVVEYALRFLNVLRTTGPVSQYQ